MGRWPGQTNNRPEAGPLAAMGQCGFSQWLIFSLSDKVGGKFQNLEAVEWRGQESKHKSQPHPHQPLRAGPEPGLSLPLSPTELAEEEAGRQGRVERAPRPRLQPALSFLISPSISHTYYLFFLKFPSLPAFLLSTNLHNRPVAHACCQLGLGWEVQPFSFFFFVQKNYQNFPHHPQKAFPTPQSIPSIYYVILFLHLCQKGEEGEMRCWLPAPFPQQLF